MNAAGHLWTLSTRLRRPLPEPAGTTDWNGEVEDPGVGTVHLSGRLHVPAGARDLLVLVHGLGGSSQSTYMLRQATLAATSGVACLRLNLRGADCYGDDFYHAGLVEDLSAAFASPQLAGFHRIYLLGNSLGGHTALLWSLAPGDSRVRAVAALCSPLDLAAGSLALDRASRWPYRRYVLAALCRIYGAVAARRAVPLPVAEAERIRTLWEWDERIVAPRHGFRGAEDYYRRSSVGPRLQELALPALYVGCVADPMVPVATVVPLLAAAPQHLTVRWLRSGGHMAFPRPAAVAPAGDSGLEASVLSWLLAR